MSAGSGPQTLILRDLELLDVRRFQVWRVDGGRVIDLRFDEDLVGGDHFVDVMAPIRPCQSLQDSEARLHLLRRCFRMGAEGERGVESDA